MKVQGNNERRQPERTPVNGRTQTSANTPAAPRAPEPGPSNPPNPTDRVPQQAGTEALERRPQNTRPNLDASEGVVRQQSDTAKQLLGDDKDYESDFTRLEAREQSARGQSGTTLEQARSLEEYEQARRVLDRPPSATWSPGANAQQAQAVETMAGLRQSYGSTLSRLREGFHELSGEVAQQQTYMERGRGALLSDQERARASEILAGRRADAMPAMEGATREMVGRLREPAFQAYLRDLPPVEQAAFFENMSQYMPVTPEGRDWIAGFSDGLAQQGASGQTSDPYAAMAVSLRNSLSSDEEQQRALDGRLGAMVGLDLTVRPQNADQRYAQIARGLGLPQEETDALNHLEQTSFEQLGSFAQGVGFARAAFSNVWGESQVQNLPGDVSSSLTYAGLAADGVRGLSALAARSSSAGSVLGRMASTLSERSGALSTAIGRAGLIASVGSAVHEWTSGGDRAASLMGLAGGALTTLGTGGPAAVAGYALIGASVILPEIQERAAYRAFDDQVTAAALGPEGAETLRGQAVLQAGNGDVWRLNRMRPADVSISEYFDTMLLDIAGEPTDTTSLGPNFWHTVAYRHDSRPRG